MTDHKFTDDEIEKAMKHCSLEVNGLCKECPLRDYSSCTEIICEYSLALINRQKAEIERIQKERRWGITLFELEAIEKHARNKAIKEFAECAKKRFSEKLGSVNESFFSYSVQREIDTLVKEMTETK